MKMDIKIYILMGLILAILVGLAIKWILSSAQRNPLKNDGLNEYESKQTDTQNFRLPDITENQKKELINLAKEAIECFIKTDTHIDYESQDAVLNQEAGVFITLRKGEALRGCIGQLWAENPLYQTVKETAISAATRDPRFPPVSAAELDDLSIKISLLSPLERVGDISEIEVGKHGLMIVYAGRRGVLLPQVPVERGWNRITFVENLCIKAGLPTDSWKENPELYSFTTLEFGV
jgi:AmmeMemoRadiSam system protein A